ncbi:MAG: hypothetical protein L3J83_04510 [Proteobacteria bacterium]|nr:hypothetical protein [Pseudomonadota bacterium]
MKPDNYLLTIVVLIIYLLLSNSKNKTIVEADNTLNSKTTDVQTLKKMQERQSENKQMISDVRVAKLVQDDERKTQHPKISYLQAYRNYKFFQQCYRVIRGAQRDEDLEAAFKLKIANSFNGLQRANNEPTEKQYAAFELFKNKCFDLMVTSNESYNENQQQLERIYQQIQPATAQEVNLYDGLALLQKYKTLNKDINMVKRGVSTLDDSIKLPIKKQMKSLSIEMSRVRAMDDYYSNETRQLQHENLQKKINELNLYLVSYNTYDSELIESLEMEQMNALQEMVLLLENNESPDVLLLYGQILMHPYVRNNLKLDIFSSIKVYDNLLALSIYNVGIMLTACALNYPCDTESLPMFQYCFNGPVIYKEACGQSIEHYIFTNVLGPNQLQDVDNFITHVLKYHAKN